VIQTSYDPEADVLQVRFGPEGAVYDGADEVAPGVFIEFDSAGNPIGVDITSAQRRAIAVAAKPAAAE
jgi:uncharacterized protein YuzE